MIVSYRLPTVIHGAQEKFFDDPFLFQNRNFPQTSFAEDAVKQRVNPLLHELLFSLVFEILPKIGCYRLRLIGNYFGHPFLF